MDNNSMFWNIITEWFGSHGLPYLTEFEAMLILLTAFLVLAFILWLVFRKLRLWYWKTDIRVETLKSIDARLHGVEERLSQGFLKDVVVVNAENAGNESTAHDGAERPSETVPGNAVNEYAGQKAIGRSGRIYTEAELELQIRE